jgi:predicted kinase
MALTLMCGLSFSGKSTLADQLAKLRRYGDPAR